MVRYSCATFLFFVAASAFAADNTPPRASPPSSTGRISPGFTVWERKTRKIQALPEAERAERFAKSLND